MSERRGSYAVTNPAASCPLVFHGRWWMSIEGNFHLFEKGFDPNEEWTANGFGIVWLPVIGMLHIVQGEPAPDDMPGLDEFWEAVAV